MLKQMLAVTMELKLDFTSTSLEISRLGRLKLWTAEEEKMMRNSSETICDPGDDEGSYGDEDELSTANLRFPTEHREDDDEPQREEFESTEVQVSHKIHEVRPQSLECCNKPSTLYHMGCFC